MKQKKKRNKKYSPRPAYAPPLVACQIYEADADVQNYMCLEKLRNGIGDDSDFDWLLDTQAGLLLGAHKAKDATAIMVAESAQEALRGIRARKERTGKHGMSGDEWRVLCDFLAFNTEWWPRQSGVTLVTAHQQLMAVREIQAKGGQG